MAQTHPIDLDLLPVPYRPRRLTLLAGLLILLGAALLMGLFPAVSALRAEHARALNAQVRLAQAETALAQVQVDRAALDQVERQIVQARDQIAQLQAEAQTVSQWQTGRAAGVASAILAALPGVRLTGITQEGAAFTISGEAGSQALVLDYARALQATGAFHNVRILSMVNSDPLGIAPEVRFAVLTER